MTDFDLQSLETLLHDFYNLTGIKTCLYDSEGNELYYYPTKLSAFCEMLREDERIDKRCRECDKRAFEYCKKTHSQYVYTCHAGLKECVSPIICDGRILGFIMIGQIKSEEQYTVSPGGSISRERAERLVSAYGSLSVISNEKLLSAFRILDACSGYEHLKTLLQGYKQSIDARIDKYVRDNLSGALSVSRLCSELHLSRHEVYTVCNEHFNTSPGEYIKRCRLSHACKLLTSTKTPVGKIATLCGIPDYNYFSKVFKSVYKISPTQYRKSAPRQN